MFFTKMAAALLVGVFVALGVYSAGELGMAACSAKSLAKPAPAFEKWYIAEDRVFYEDSDAVLTHRRHVVSPEGEWFIVPPAYKELVDGWADGSIVQVPPHIRMWERPQDGSRGVPPSKTEPLTLSNGSPLATVMSRPVAVYNDLR